MFPIGLSILTYILILLLSLSKRLIEFVAEKMGWDIFKFKMNLYLRLKLGTPLTSPAGDSLARRIFSFAIVACVLVSVLLTMFMTVGTRAATNSNFKFISEIFRGTPLIASENTDVAGAGSSKITQYGHLPVHPATFPSLDTLSWGAYTGWQNSDIIDFEQKVGKKMPLAAVFIHWGNENEFPSYLSPTVKDEDKTLVIFWESLNYNIPSAEQPRFSYDAILKGDWDSYIASFAADAKNYAWPVILIPFSEMNGDWYPWSVSKNGNNAQKHIQAYQYLHKFFVDAPNVKFGWAINVNNTPGLAKQIKLYYPGDQYVDYVGADGFNTGDPWQSFSEIYGRTIKGLKVLNKPIYIFSIASAAGPKKAAWIKDALKTQIQKYPEVKGWIWFNENKEKDWRVWSDQDSLTAFKMALNF